MKLKKLYFFIFSLFFLSLAAPRPILAADAYLFLSPTSGSHSTNFNLAIKVNTGGHDTGGVDVYLEFPKNLLKVESVTKGGAFSEVNSLILNEQGKLRLTAYFPIEEAAQSYTGEDGLVATVTFSPLESGSAAVKFVCTSGATNDSNIVEKTTNQEIINCESNLDGTYNLTATGPTNTPTATQTPQAILSPTPTPSIPVSGSITQTVSLITIGLTTLLTGLVLLF